MKTSFVEDGMLSFEQDNEEEKVFCAVGTIYGDGDNFARFLSEKDINDDGWYDPEEWTKDIFKLEVGETSTYAYWFYDKANVIVRVA